jgi:hypothetical protein
MNVDIALPALLGPLFQKRHLKRRGQVVKGSAGDSAAQRGHNSAPS